MCVGSTETGLNDRLWVEMLLLCCFFILWKNGLPCNHGTIKLRLGWEVALGVGWDGNGVAWDDPFHRGCFLRFGECFSQVVGDFFKLQRGYFSFLVG